MSTAYSARDWTAMFAASAGASAALTGLLFVAVSVNIERILDFSGLPERALQTLLMLLSAVIISLAVLIPGQSAAALGVELLALSVASGVALGRLLVASEPALRQYARASANAWILLVEILR
jgi:modulator of FtsH protease